MTQSRDYIPETDKPERPLRPALRNGLRCRCPRCGTGAVFDGYLKVRAACPDCGLDYTPQRADDGPAYVTILLVGHVGIFLLPLVYPMLHQTPLIMGLVLSVICVGLALAMLPPVKGGFVAVQWAKRMYGF